jgi:hypothetical protein
MTVLTIGAAECSWRRTQYSSLPGVLFGGCGCAVEDAGGGADAHVERDAVVGVAGDAGHVGGVEFPGEQCSGAEHVPQAVPCPRALAAGVAPPGGRVGRGQDAPVGVRGPPVPVGPRREDEEVRPSGWFRLPARRGPVRCGRRAARRAGSRPARTAGRSSCGAFGSSAPRRTGAPRPRPVRRPGMTLAGTLPYSAATRARRATFAGRKAT